MWMDKRSSKPFYIEKPIRSGHIAFLVTRGKVRFQNILWQPTLASPIFDADGYTGEIPYKVFDGAYLTGDNAAGFHLLYGAIESKKVYDNFMLQTQYFQRNNSGQSSLFVRSEPGVENTGYEISLQNFPKRQDREKKRGVDAGGFVDMKDARYVRAQDQQWTYFTAVVMNRQIQTWVNGVPVGEMTDRKRVKEKGPAELFTRSAGPFLKPGTIRFSVPADNSDFQFRRLILSPILP